MRERATVKAADSGRPEISVLSGAFLSVVCGECLPTSFTKPLFRDLVVRELDVLRTFSPRVANAESLSDSAVSAYQ